MSASDFDTEAAADIVALSGMDGRLSGSELVSSEDKLADGDTKFALSVSLVTAQERVDANIVRDVADAIVTVYHRLSAADAERTYRTGEMVTHQAAMLRSSFWLGMDSVYGVEEGPEEEEPPTREGRVLSYALKVRVALA